MSLVIEKTKYVLFNISSISLNKLWQKALLSVFSVLNIKILMIPKASYILGEFVSRKYLVS